MTRVGEGAYAASNARRRWLTSDSTGAIENGARAEQLSKALSIGFGSVNVLQPPHVTSRTPVVDLAGPSYEDRFVKLPDGPCVTRAAVAIAAKWGSIELLRCCESRSLAKRDSLQKSSVSKSLNQERFSSKNPEMAQNLDAPSVEPSKLSSSTNSASGSLPKTIQNMSNDEFRTSTSCIVARENSAHAWLECVSSALCETELSVGPLRSTIQILSTLPLVASAVNIPIMSVYNSHSLLGSCFYRAPSEPNRVNTVLRKHGESLKFRSVPRAAIVAKANSRLLSRSNEHNPSTNEKTTDNGNISPSTPVPTKQAEGGSSEASKLESEMKTSNLANYVVGTANQQESREIGSRHLTVGYKLRLAAPHSHWNKLLKSLEANEEEVEEAAGYAKKSDMAKTSTPLSALLIKRKQKSEQRQINRRRLQTKAQLTSGLKRSSSSSGTLSSSPNRRPFRKSRVGNPIRDWSSAELSSDGDELYSPLNKKTTVRKLFV